MARTEFEKVCPVCSKSFTVNTGIARKTYCTPACAHKMVHKSRTIMVDRLLLEDVLASKDSYQKKAERLGVTPWTFYRLVKREGLTLPKKDIKKRSDGYWGYTTESNHRKIVEMVMGRKLKRGECVHHIDGDKTNNKNSNLLVCTTGYHQWLHSRMSYLYQRMMFGNRTSEAS